MMADSVFLAQHVLWETQLHDAHQKINPKFANQVEGIGILKGILPKRGLCHK